MSSLGPHLIEQVDEFDVAEFVDVVLEAMTVLALSEVVHALSLVLAHAVDPRLEQQFSQ